MHILSRVATKALLMAGLCTLFFVPGVFGQSRPVTIEQLARQSEVVAIGQVKDLSSEWDETGTRIRTKVLLYVDQFVKGSGSGNTLTLYVPGGEVGTVGEVYSHMPTFRRDEEVIVFAEQDKLHHYRVSDGQQGKFTIQKDHTSGKAMVSGHSSLDEFTIQVKATVERYQSGDKPNH